MVVSLSTLEQGQGPVLHRIFAALAGLPELKALVTLEPALDARQFVAPSNVLIAPFATHSAALPHASATITQCGIGGVTKALRQCPHHPQQRAPARWHG